MIVDTTSGMATSAARLDPETISSHRPNLLAAGDHGKSPRYRYPNYIASKLCMKEKLLVVVDDEDIQAQIRWAVGTDYDLAVANDRTSALRTFRDALPLVVILSLGLPPVPDSVDEGLATLAELIAIEPLTKIVIISSQAEGDIARQAVGIGAYDFLCKPINVDELKLMLARCYHVAHLEREHREMNLRLTRDSFEGLLGNSAPMLAVFDTIKKVADTDAPVLIVGAVGTGKETVAHAIHFRSSRQKRPIIALNCSALAGSLLESELFGHEKDAFPGAHVQRKGRIEAAFGGTLFLDDVEEIPPAIQVKLRRFLQEQLIERVGGNQPIAVNTRIIAATTVDLKERVAAGTFREDLYYRLAIVQIDLPSLTERGDDIVLLAHAFLHNFAASNRTSALSFSADALKALRQHTWPGNVRELQSRVRRGVIMSDKNQVSAADLGLGSDEPSLVLEGSSLRNAREQVERELVQKALRKHAGNISAASAELGVSRPTLYELIQKLGVEKNPDSPKQPAG